MAAGGYSVAMAASTGRSKFWSSAMGELQPSARHATLRNEDQCQPHKWEEPNAEIMDKWERSISRKSRKPKRQCSIDGVCGRNSSCNEKEELMCKCLPGYKSRYAAVWNSEKWEQGCIEVRERQCDDAAKEDHYMTLNIVMLGSGSSAQLVFNHFLYGITCGQYCDRLHCDCKAYVGVNKTCYIWFEAEQLTHLKEDLEEDRSKSDVLENSHNYDHFSSSLTGGRGRRCGYYGTYDIPYPSSTGANCGDHACNSFHCNGSNGQLSFVTPDDSSYAVSGINPENRTFFIKLEGLELCWEGSSKRSDIHLDKRVQIECDAPLEPVCDAEDDCDAWTYSSCLASSADEERKRCLCNDNFR
ncbi:hypothetical protein ACLOJK_039736 [Asimina triloba]